MNTVQKLVLGVGIYLLAVLAYFIMLSFFDARMIDGRLTDEELHPLEYVLQVSALITMALTWSIAIISALFRGVWKKFFLVWLIPPYSYFYLYSRWSLNDKYTNKAQKKDADNNSAS